MTSKQIAAPGSKLSFFSHRSRIGWPTPSAKGPGGSAANELCGGGRIDA